MQTIKSKNTGKRTDAPVPGWKERCWRRLGFTNQPVIKLYLGYGHAENLIMYGHALALSPLGRKKFSRQFPFNLLALIRMFIVQPIKGTSIRLQWEDKIVTTTTDTDGFIKLNWSSDTPISFGWHDVKAELLNPDQSIRATAYGSLHVPHSTQFAFISDIDDTFLISHSANLRKRLSVLFTHNARTRRPFEGVVNHYQLLAHAHTRRDEPNPFFYVSSSEWNLYEYILEFIRVNGLPKGVLLLASMKTLTHFLSTGQKGHGAKFTRIVRILEAYPKQTFVLLGDSSQQDPVIYKSIAEHFPGRIHAIYIRDIHQKKSHAVQTVLQQIEETGIPCCFFRHSAAAIAHSKKIGLIR